MVLYLLQKTTFGVRVGMYTLVYKSPALHITSNFLPAGSDSPLNKYKEGYLLLLHFSQEPHLNLWGWERWTEEGFSLAGKTCSLAFYSNHVYHSPFCMSRILPGNWGHQGWMGRDNRGVDFSRREIVCNSISQTQNLDQEILWLSWFGGWRSI